ncbi:helix-turn-helix domain-containing protein [Microbacterium dauci]|uniref:Helix-turn-helix transcriptional regulator n=1 Tax=Microbacterium dauci TaxID=3048008 RepID=A0ABT6ZGV9_9MICO|nr:helix-turn-helix transcriptional regulator [Microbacterium sp. LX3-4]MDJ1115401.1 helix-turn-helix transcriptional regulator [Microbacterium sp. LX3-4]
MSQHDDLIGENLARLRDSVSQTELANRMRERGHKWTQPTVVAVEKGERPLRLGEAIDIAEVLGVDLQDLVDYPAALTFYNQMVRAEESRAQMLLWAARYEAQARALVREAAAYRKETGESVDSEIEDWGIVTSEPADHLDSARAALLHFIEYAKGGPERWASVRPIDALISRYEPKVIADGEHQAEA